MLSPREKVSCSCKLSSGTKPLLMTHRQPVSEVGRSQCPKTPEDFPGTELGRQSSQWGRYLTRTFVCILLRTQTVGSMPRPLALLLRTALAHLILTQPCELDMQGWPLRLREEEAGGDWSTPQPRAALCKGLGKWTGGARSLPAAGSSSNASSLYPLKRAPSVRHVWKGELKSSVQKLGDWLSY